MRLLGSGCHAQVSIYPDNPDNRGYEAKTSIRIEVLNEAAWCRVPYPGKNIYPDNPDDWGYEAKTSIRIEVLNEAAWFRVPYPGKYIPR